MTSLFQRRSEDKTMAHDSFAIKSLETLQGNWVKNFPKIQFQAETK